MPFPYDVNNVVYLSRYFNKDFFSQAPIREKQDSKFVRKIRKKAVEKMGGPLRLNDTRSFYVGSMDFMVMEKDNGHEFAILESNGGSTRGILAISEEQTEVIFNAYKYAIDQVLETDFPKLVIIGAITNDKILQEKIMLTEYLKYRYNIEGLKVGVYNSLSFEKRDNDEDITLVIANYPNLFQRFSYKNGEITFMGEKVGVLIGDGITRRYPIIGAYMKYDPDRIKVSIVNRIYQVSDDKASTYLAAYMAKDILSHYRVKPLLFYKAFDPYHLEKALSYMVDKFQKNLVIKPFGGSGGAGVFAIPKTSREEDMPGLMDSSIFDFYKKFDKRRDPFPYTVQEMADFKLIDWKNSKRAFDIRIYVVQKDGCLFPVGGSARIARAPYTGNFTKDEFVVNICGPWGAEVERALGFSEECFDILNMEEDDLVDLFCASCQFFQFVSENHLDIVNFKDWDKFIEKPEGF